MDSGRRSKAKETLDNAFKQQTTEGKDTMDKSSNDAKKASHHRTSKQNSEKLYRGFHYIASRIM
jgi:hypothetical protein